MLNPRTRSAGKEEDVAEGHAGGAGVTEEDGRGRVSWRQVIH